MSGYTRDLVSDDLDGELLVEPFNRAQLLGLVARVLDRDASGS